MTTFAYLQDLYVRGKAGFEATILTMNTRAATLFEGIANNAILIAHGVTEVEQLPDEDLQIGVLLALLQDDAKNQSSYLTWGEGGRKPEVAATLRRDFLVTKSAPINCPAHGDAIPARPDVSAGLPLRARKRLPSCGEPIPPTSVARNLRMQGISGYPDD